MDVLEILKIVSIVATFVIGTAVPFVIALVKTIKDRKNAKTEAEKAAATNDMLTTVNGFIAAAEETYKGIEAVLKQTGGSTGAVKKDSVMTKLQAYAIERGYNFDANFWSEKIDSIVALTKSVNAK